MSISDSDKHIYLGILIIIIIGIASANWKGRHIQSGILSENAVRHDINNLTHAGELREKRDSPARLAP